jgi:hypothetical protein
MAHLHNWLLRIQRTLQLLLQAFHLLRNSNLLASVNPVAWALVWTNNVAVALDPHSLLVHMVHPHPRHSMLSINLHHLELNPILQDLISVLLSDLISLAL